MRKWLNGKRQKLVLVVTLVALASLVAGVGATCVVPAEGYVASGWVLTDEGEGIASVVLSFEPEFGITASDYGGAWSKAGLRDEVTISPAKPGWEFNPEQVNVTEGTQGVNFTGTFVDPLVLAGDYIVTGFLWLQDEEVPGEPELGAFEGSFSLHVGPSDVPEEFQLYKTALEGTSEGFLLDHPELGLVEIGPMSMRLDPELVPQGSYNLTTWEFEMLTPLLITIESLDPNSFPAIWFEEGVLDPACDHYASAGYIEVLDGPLAGILLSADVDEKMDKKECKPFFYSTGAGTEVTDVKAIPAASCELLIDNRPDQGGVWIHGKAVGTVIVIITYLDKGGKERIKRLEINFT